MMASTFVQLTVVSAAAAAAGVLLLLLLLLHQVRTRSDKATPRGLDRSTTTTAARTSWAVTSGTCSSPASSEDQ